MSNITYRPSNHPGGPRHYLDGRPIHCGYGLDLLTPIGWLPGRFELAHRPPTTVEGPLIEDGKVPMFYAQLPVQKGHSYATGSVGTSISFAITEHHVFRWPAGDKYSRRRPARRAAASDRAMGLLLEVQHRCSTRPQAVLRVHWAGLATMKQDIPFKARAGDFHERQPVTMTIAAHSVFPRSARLASLTDTGRSGVHRAPRPRRLARP